MFDVFGSVKDLLVLDTICIDNNIFRLHYKVGARSWGKESLQTPVIRRQYRRPAVDNEFALKCVMFGNRWCSLGLLETMIVVLMALSQATVVVLITCSLLVTSRQYIGRLYNK